MHLFSTTFSAVLEFLMQFTGDWFIAIVLLTLAIKLLLFPVSIKQQKALLLSQNVNEAKNFLTKKFKNRSEKVNEALAKIMAKHKVNPFMPVIAIALQMPVLFSLYFSLMNISTGIGSSLVPWILSVGKPDALHVLPVVAGLFQGLPGLTAQDKSLLTFALPMVIGMVFLWKAPAALSVYWGINALLGFIEKKILSLKSIQQRFLSTVSVEEMISSID